LTADKPAGKKKAFGTLARLCLARDVVECPECGEPEPFLGIFLRQGRAGAVRLSRLEWITHAPGEFVRWVARVCPRWRRAREIYVNHCSSCAAPLADPLGFREPGAWLCDTGIDVAVSTGKKAASVAGFSPGAVVVPGGEGLWEEFLRLTPRDFRKRFREGARFLGEGKTGYRLFLIAAPAPHRWRLVEPSVRGRKPAVDESFFTFTQAKQAASVRFGIPPAAWRVEA
jgi:hypothetical protein